MGLRLLAAAVLGLGVLVSSASADIILGGASIVVGVETGATTASGSSGTALAAVKPLELVQYAPIVGISAEKVLTEGAWNTLLGDEDFDGDLHGMPGGGVDALALRPWKPNPEFFAPWTLYDYVYSVREPFGGATATGDAEPRGAADGSIFRFRVHGAPSTEVQVVLSESQIRAALGQAVGEDLDVDAVAFTPGGDVLLSFADDELVQGVLLGDGGLCAIPAAAIVWSASDVATSVAPGSAVIVLSEGAVDAMVQAAGVQDASTIGDLTGVCVDLLGQTFVGDDGATWPDLLFTGDALGANVLTTVGGGSFGVVVGLTVGGPTSFPGQVGLATLDGALSALEVVEREQGNLVIDQADGQVDWPAETQVEWNIGNAWPNSQVMLFIAVYPGPVGAWPTSAPVYGVDFPRYFPTPVYPNLSLIVPTDAHGIGTFGGDLWHSVSGNYLISQAFDPIKNELGAPALMWFP